MDSHVTFVSLILITLSCTSIAIDTLSSSGSLTDNGTLVSANQKFRLGFFSPGSSSKRYLGIWYNNIPTQTIVWVANREDPINDTSGILKIGDDGNLILVQQVTGTIVWSTNVKNISSSVTAFVRILHSGNLVLGEEGATSLNSFIWQSFDHPSDTQLAGMKLGWDLTTGLDRNLTSWKSENDPSRGDYSYNLDTIGFPQLVLRKGLDKQFRTVFWEEIQFYVPGFSPKLAFSPKVVTGSKEVYYEFDLFNESTLTMSALSYSGTVQRLIWDNSTLEWLVQVALPRHQCDNYGKCGPNAICTINDPRICSCLAGYVPKSSQDWDVLIWSGGCVRKIPLDCPAGEGFIALEKVKKPDFLKFWINTSMRLQECEGECLKNCSCTAYADLNVTGGGSGCLLWFGDLVDIRKLEEATNQKLYIRVPASDLPPISESKKKKNVVVVPVAVVASIAVVLLIASFIIWKCRLRKEESKWALRVNRNGDATAYSSGSLSISQDRNEEKLELAVFNIITISEATNNFPFSNKIGEGGFGPVYKGRLSTGQEIAVKKLSESSQQGLNEFKNEVVLITNLQHRNLVRLLGCCIQGEERMLIYEYMPNGSLDSFIFDNKSSSLAWTTRFDIVVGIARGVLYLHRDSRLRIIHRDLKASNVLLDSEMNPKISDFGIARAVGADQLLNKTRTVVGTYGYMSPEYVIRGLFSMKSDVFSFGVLALEIVSGRRNQQVCHPDQNLYLVGHAWKLWTEGKALELVDPIIEHSFSVAEVLRCIQVGLLCVQQSPGDRPTMSTVVSMLDSDIEVLQQPKQPGFVAESSGSETEISSSRREFLANKLTSTLEAR